MFRLVIVVLLTLLPQLAFGHQTGASNFVVHVRPDIQQVDTLLTFPGQDAAELLGWDVDSDGEISAAELLPRLGDLAKYVDKSIQVFAGDTACEPIETKAGPPGQAMDAYWYMKAFRCPQMDTLRIELTAMEGEPYTHFGRIQVGDDEVYTTVFNAQKTSYELGKTTEFDAVAFIILGIEHILIGLDHVLFVLLLVLLAPRLRVMLAIVTSFTVAHSITLALATMEVVTLSPSIVEPLIAISIAAFALETGLRKETPKYLPIATFLFGLLHGFGFAFVLASDVGLPSDSRGLALVTFNVGVEIGQIAIVLLAFPIRRWMCEKPWERKAIISISAVIGALAVYWTIERIFWA